MFQNLINFDVYLNNFKKKYPSDVIMKKKYNLPDVIMKKKYNLPDVIMKKKYNLPDVILNVKNDIFNKEDKDNFLTNIFIIVFST
jgi:hypothetical protein